MDGGWDARTGRRLWTLVPPHSGDFNVPTPLVHEGRLMVATENNGARGGRIINDIGDTAVIANNEPEQKPK